MKSVGQHIERVDGWPKVLGEPVYAGDLKLPGMLHCALHRSAHPHARLLGEDAARAKAHPGVRAVVTGQDLLAVPGLDPYFGFIFRDQPLLAIGKVRFIGEPVAAVAADTREEAEAAAALVRVEYDPLPVVDDPVEAARPGSPTVHDTIRPGPLYPNLRASHHGPDSNVCTHYRLRVGDVDRALAEAAAVFEDTFRSPPAQHAHLEPHSAVARVDPDGHVTVWTSSQSPSPLRMWLASMFGVPQNRVRVIVPYLGGGYGGKLYLKMEPFAVLLSKWTGRPVRAVARREEVFYLCSRHGAAVRIKTAVSREGKISAQQFEIHYDCGAYAESGPRVAWKAAATASGPYKIPNVRVDSLLVYTNKTPAGAFRGFGVPQITFAQEAHMDVAAEYLGRDPVELRMEHALQEGDRYPSGELLDCVAIKECLAKAAEAFGWTASGRAAGRASGSGGRVARGRGVGLAIKTTATPTGSEALLALNADGTANLLVSTVEMGQGCDTVLSQLAAEALGIPVGKVRLVRPDTDVTPFDMATASSRSTFHMGNAIQRAAAEVRRELFAAASEILEVPPDQLELADGRVFVAGLPERGLSLADVFQQKLSKTPGGCLVGRGTYMTQAAPEDPKTGRTEKLTVNWSSSAAAAEVEVDRETGVVKVLRLFVAANAGKAIHMRHCEQQILGAAILNVGLTLFEQMDYQNAQLLNGSFLEYMVPTFEDVPGQFVPLVLEESHPLGPYGAKGVGESGCIATTPAIVNAIHDAAGVWVRDLPVTPEKVLRAIRETPVRSSAV
ncbi:MAG: xanthine dehydrogenase family protein molybdopterin-binding subunit [Candidatus Tectomicrobia bacterium]|nr:xanthine dehydrogenase family protein molybdopterin-binding subunit [Candidatus Tectomicrobia bacterium]